MRFAAADAGNSVAAANLNLYDPLIEALQHGASITLHHGELIADGTAITIDGWQNKFLAD